MVNLTYKQLIVITRNQCKYNSNGFKQFLFIITNTKFAIKKGAQLFKYLCAR